MEPPGPGQLTPSGFYALYAGRTRRVVPRRIPHWAELRRRDDPARNAHSAPVISMPWTRIRRSGRSRRCSEGALGAARGARFGQGWMGVRRGSGGTPCPAQPPKIHLSGLQLATTRPSFYTLAREVSRHKISWNIWSKLRNYHDL